MELTWYRHLESLSVHNRYWNEEGRGGILPLHWNGTSNSGIISRYLIDSLATLSKLKSLELDLHVSNRIRAPRPSGIVNLAGLRNLQVLIVPFHFFVKRGPQGICRVVSPASVLPRTLKALKIVACFQCLDSWTCRDIDEQTYHHTEAVLEFLEGLASLHAEYFPSLSTICWEESEMDRGDTSNLCQRCGHRAHFNTNYEPWHFAAVSTSLLKRDVLLEESTKNFGCWIHW